MRTVAGIVILAVALAQAAARPSLAQEAQRLAVEETVLGSGPTETLAATIGGPLVSADNRRVAFVVEEGGQYRVVVNDRAGEPFDDIPYGLGGYEVALSRDGAHVAHLGIRAGKLHVVVDGVASEPFDQGTGAYITYSPDGEHVTFVAGPEGSQVLVVDGRIATEPHEELGGSLYDAGGTRAANYAKRGGLEYFLMNGIAGRGYASVLWPEWSRTGSHFAHAAQTDEGWCVVVDGREGKTYPQIGGGFAMLDPLRFCPSGGRLAYKAHTDDGDLIVIDDVENGPVPELTALEWSPDGKRIALGIAESDGYDLVLVNTFGEPEEGAPQDPEPKRYPSIDTRSIRFSPDGRRVAYIATLRAASDPFEIFVEGEEALTDAGADAIVLDGVEQAPYPPDTMTLGGFQNEIVFSPDSRRTAWLVRQEDGLQRAVLDGVAGQAFERIGTEFGSSTMTFSPDGSHLAYLAWSQGRVRLVIDGRESPTFDGSIAYSRIAWESPTTVSFVAHRGGTILRVVASLEG